MTPRRSDAADRILREAMRLFAERGYERTTVPDIQEAAGLAPGSGAMYKHYPSKDAVQEPEYRPARAIKHFTEPRILLKGTAEEIGLDSRTLSSALGIRFLQELPFLQSDFAFDKTYETWEIGLFECEAWTVGSKYPIAFHVQCSGGSMDEPGHWRYATLGYGPKDKIVEIVKNTLDSIIAEYAAFVRKAHGRTES